MIIDLSTISHTLRSYCFEKEPEWWEPADPFEQIRGFEAPLKVRVSVSRHKEKILFHGEISGTLRTVCDRCLESFPRHLGLNFRVQKTTAPPEDVSAEMELSREDVSVDMEVRNEIDLDDIIREQIYLSQPMRSVCREGCKGLCPTCGVNLNIESCKCSSSCGHPGFSGLAQFELDKGK